MLREIRSRAGRWLRRGYRFSDLALAALGQPRLFVAAFRLVTRRKARAVESGLRLVQHRPALQAAVPVQPLARGALLQGLAARFGVLLLDDGAECLRIGLAEVDLLSALYWLGRSAHGAQLRAGRTRLAPSATDFRSAALAAREITVDFLDPDGRPDAIVVEPYFRHDGGKWVSSNPANTEARALYDDSLAAPGVTRVADLLGAPSFDQMWRGREIDLVYTWVNHADPDWAALYHRYRAEIDRSGTDPRPQSDDATALTRFHSNDELRYSLRSVAENLPWVRQIHVFTNCAPPDWLNRGHPGIKWVRHEEVIPPQYLPTFNSHVIESFLHHIPGLAEHFIYMNDDFFVARPLDRGYFFDHSGATRVLLEPYGKVLGPVVAGAPDYLNAARNSATLIRDAFGFAATRLHRHSPYALRRDLMDEIDLRWPAELDAMRRNRFRTGQDLNVASFLHHHHALATGRAVLASGRCILVKSQDIRWRAQLTQALGEGTDTFCINEGGAADPGRDWHRRVRRVLGARWPQRAEWEAAGQEAATRPLAVVPARRIPAQPSPAQHGPAPRSAAQRLPQPTPHDPQSARLTTHSPLSPGTP